MGQVFDARVKSTTFELRIAFRKSYRCEGAREQGWGGEVGNSHDGGCAGTLQTSRDFLEEKILSDTVPASCMRMYSRLKGYGKKSVSAGEAGYWRGYQ